MAAFATIVVVGLSLLSLFSLVVSDNYLIMFPPETGSQTVALATAATTMIEQNHTVTLLVANGFSENLRKRMYSDKYNMEIFQSSITVESYLTVARLVTGSGLKGNHVEMLKNTPYLLLSFYHICEDLFRDQELIQRLEKQKFDLVFAHVAFACPVLLAQRLDVKFVTILTAIPPSPFLRMYGNPVNPAYTPEMMTGFSNQMTFLQRVQNTIMSVGGWQLIESVYKNHDNLKEQYNIKPEISTFESVSQAELFFICSHFTLDFPRAYQPNVISVGGLSAVPPRPLPKDLDDFMQSSGEAGVLIFSMGSQINAMSIEKADIIAEAFAKIPYKVLWKLGGDPPSKIPPNVKVSKWLPQNDLLGHPKTRAMIYHCGLNGVFEAIHHAVPVICIPVLADQYDNAKRLEVKGVSLQLDWFTLTSEAIVKAVDTIIGDKSYQTNMTRLSAIFHDEPLPAAQRVVYWMEKVVRHGGAGHLRPSAALELNSIQHNLLDVTAFIATIVVIILTIVIYIGMACCRCCLRCCKGSGKQKAE